MDWLRQHVHFLGVIACLVTLPVAVMLGGRDRADMQLATAYTPNTVLRFPDGSRATLSMGSRVRYRVDLPHRRTAWLFGEGTFEIAAGSDFTLWTETSLIKTTGGRFFITATDRDSTFVTVRQGVLRLRALNEDGDPAYRSVLVASGQRAFAAKTVGANLSP
jgi:ferric-dicitrate binding protein FerR (iron transport regulator)